MRACRSLFVCCKALGGASRIPGLNDCVDSRITLELAYLLFWASPLPKIARPAADAHLLSFSTASEFSMCYKRFFLLLN